ncbi:serine protease [Lithospermum erythrorhizon]|uniref:Prolyl endopeptidase-like n=1 Tax=Lithospermum erythrorhizon TaxID=34254 RepID=A0AAV3NMN9_LITER
MAAYVATFLRTQLPKKPHFPFFSTKCRANHSHLPPPKPKKIPFTVPVHGVNIQDPYHWMVNLQDPDFISYIKQENSYTDAFMKNSHGLQRKLYNEMVSRLPNEISTPPEKWGPWLYYQYIPEEKEYPVLCRKLAFEGQGWMKNIVHVVSGHGRQEILLDWNEIAEQYGTCRISPDHKFLAYTLDANGSEHFVLHIKDLQNNIVLPQFRVEGVVSLAWASDGCSLFYTLTDKNQRPYRVQCIRLEMDSVDGTSLFIENDPSFCVDITSTKDGKFITVNSNSRTSSEEGTCLSNCFALLLISRNKQNKLLMLVFSSYLKLQVYVIDSGNLKAGLQRFCQRVSGVQYFLEHHHGFFYVLTNAPTKENDSDIEGYCLARCRVKDMPFPNLQYITLPSEGIFLQDMDMFNDHLVLFLTKEGTSSICSIDMPVNLNIENHVKIDSLNPWFFPLPSDVCSISPGSNHDFVNSIYRVVLSSPVMPDVIVDYNMSEKSFSIVKQEEVISTDAVKASSPRQTNKPLTATSWKDYTSNILKGWNSFSDTYCCSKEEVIARDGSMIPLTILYSRKTHRKGKSPGLLHGYGAYGEVLDKSWCSERLSLLDRGWAIAFADVRGGSGADPSWHSLGRGLNKFNSIYDFMQCGEYLVNEGYVNASQLCALTISAGSLLVGAAINMRPDLFRAAILKVPFLDICNTLLDPNLPLTILDYEEFGDPRSRSHFDYIMKYSPYDNIPGGVCLPATLVTASFNDSRVSIWEAAKWVAKVRDLTCRNCSSSVILRTNMTGGHFGEGGRSGQCEEAAFDAAPATRAAPAPPAAPSQIGGSQSDSSGGSPPAPAPIGAALLVGGGSPPAPAQLGGGGSPPAPAQIGAALLGGGGSLPTPAQIGGGGSPPAPAQIGATLLGGGASPPAPASSDSSVVKRVKFLKALAPPVAPTPPPRAPTPPHGAPFPSQVLTPPPRALTPPPGVLSPPKAPIPPLRASSPDSGNSETDIDEWDDDEEGDELDMDNPLGMGVQWVLLIVQPYNSPTM